MSASDAMIELCDLDGLVEGAPRRVKPEGLDPIAVCRVGGEVYAVADTCSHGMASLSDGDIEGLTIYCPFHGGAFDLRTGLAVEKPCTLPIRRYAVVVQEGRVYALLGT